jgi:hypothetical protein
VTAMLKRIHVNQHVIRDNLKTVANAPCVTVQTYKGPQYGHRVDVLDKEGNVICSVVQQIEKPLSCGARVWIETEAEVAIRLYETEEPAGACA